MRVRFHPAPIAAALSAALVVAQPAPSFAVVLDLPAQRDTWLRESNPGENHGTDGSLNAMRSDSDDRRPLLAFDLDPIAGWFVRSAFLRLNVTDVDQTGKAVEIYRVTSAWAESTATWATHGNAYDSTRVYGSFLADVAGSVLVDVTVLAREWADGTRPNYGLMLLPTSIDDESRYTSREGGVPTEQPALVVDAVSVLATPIDLSVKKAIDDPAPHEGDVVTFTVSVTNVSGYPATGVAVSDLLPPGLTLSAARPGQGQYFPGTGAWSVGSVGPAEAVKLALSATVEPGTGGTRITNVATLTTLDQIDSNPANDTGSASVDIVAPTSSSISGVLFEDVNYGGGAGRDGAAAAGVPRPGARVELYDDAGTFLTATTTQSGGAYAFPGLDTGN